MTKSNWRTDEQKARLPNPPEKWDRCHFYVERKNRFCKQWPVNGRKYCGNHQHLEDESLLSMGNGVAKKDRKRIPCPIDPSHMIFEDNIKKHILICPRAKKRRRQEEEPYFSENVNCGGHGELISNPATQNSTSNFEPDTLEWAKNIARRVLIAHQSIFNNEKECNVSTLTQDDIHAAIALEDLSQPEIDAGIEEGFRSHHVKSGGLHHTRQIASLIGHLKQMGYMKPQKKEDKISSILSNKEKPLIIIEMGAGRGMFGLTAAGVAKANGANTHFFMVDRAGARSKADKAFRTIPKNTDISYLNLDGVNWCRLCCDVSHVNLPVVIENDNIYNGADIVVIAKHLCGAGTDLALKSLIPIRNKISGCLIATCCHGVCDWQHYVGRDILRRIMEGSENYSCNNISSFGPKEFDLLRRWSGATVATRKSKSKSKTSNEEKGRQEKIARKEEIVDSIASDENHIISITDDTTETSISVVVRELGLSCTIQGLGRACQRLIDYGRSTYIQQHIFQDDNNYGIENHISYYVSPDITPQNAIIKTYRKQGTD